MSRRQFILTGTAGLNASRWCGAAACHGQKLAIENARLVFEEDRIRKAFAQARSELGLA